VDAEVKRPLWSVMIPTYNCANYLPVTLNSVLAQDPGEHVMQIEVIDDHSTQDDPAAVVAKLGHGRVGFYQQPHNVGHCANFNSAIEHSSGQLIHLLHGDDAVRAGYYEKMQTVFANNESIGAAFCRYISMDEHGNWLSISPLEQRDSGVMPEWLDTIATGQRLQPPCMVVRRQVYEQVGGFDGRITAYGEDWEMWVRIAARYSVWYEVEPLALYRIHPTSLSNGSIRTGSNGRDMRLVLMINKASLPVERAEALTYYARKNFALGCLRRAHRLLDAGNSTAMFAQVREALKTNLSLSIVARAAFLSLRWAAQAIQAILR
jgi:GT2 family glycosyltransferase